MKNQDIPKVVKILRETIKDWKQPVVGAMTRDPYKVLISTILSLRTKDATTEAGSNRLFALADTPEKMLQVDVDDISKAIYPVGFYNTKAHTILEISKTLLDKYEGKVPNDIDELLTLKGVGRKTANLTVTLGYDSPGICVDVHVHRITNRWGYVKTKNPDATEVILRDILPKEYWIEINHLLVTYGQNLCTPVSPKCSICTIYKYCDRVDVTSSR